MARIRSVHPEFWENEEVGALSRDARLLFIGTWNLADDEGLLRWAAPYLKANVFMYDDDVTVADVEHLMSEITSAGFLFEYKGGKTQQRLGWIPSFRKHQKPNRPQSSKLPPPSLQNPAVCQRYAERDDWTCALCGDEIPHVFGNVIEGGLNEAKHGLSMDHKVPRSVGGSDYPTNIQAVHKSCNSSKRDTLPDSGEHSLSDAVNDSVSVTSNGSSPERRGEERKGEAPIAQEPVDSPVLVLVPEHSSPPATDRSDVHVVFDAWREATGKRRAKLDRKRRTRIEWALKNYSLDETVAAVRGWRHSAHHRGENRQGTVYNAIELLLRDSEHFEKFRDFELRQTPADAVADRLSSDSYRGKSRFG